MYHSTLYTNKEARRLLQKAGIHPDNVALAKVIGKPARTKGTLILKENRITIFLNDCVIHGYLKTGQNAR